MTPFDQGQVGLAWGSDWWGRVLLSEPGQLPDQTFLLFERTLGLTMNSK